MPYDIIVGRDDTDKEKFGRRGTIFLGKGFVSMGETSSLSNRIWMDVARSHVILVVGKRGSGKSYSLGVIAEELSSLQPESAKNIASVIFDTMGIFWAMKYKNEKDKALLQEWGLEPRTMPVSVIIPFGKKAMYQEQGIPYDTTFALEASELEAEDWGALFNLEFTSSESILLSRVVSALRQEKGKYSLRDIHDAVKRETRSAQHAQEPVSALLEAAASWGIFAEGQMQGIGAQELVRAGATSILDVSTYSSLQKFHLRALIISLLSRKIFQQRLASRKREEIDAVRHGQDYLGYTGQRSSPLVWIFIDEAHEFLPKEGTTPATDALIQLLREGRQPGISLVLATQQPGQIHRDAMSQADLVIAHRVTAKQDMEALNEMMQTYLLESIKQAMDVLPALKGSAILLDDNSERLYPLRVRPRYTWHGGESPAAVKADVKI